MVSSERSSMIPIRSIHIFTVVGKHLNLVSAADELFLTQSALSKQIKSLEIFLGVRLFDRKSRGLSFTEEGEVLYEHMQPAFRTIDEGVNKVGERKGATSLTLSASRGISQRVISRNLVDFVGKHPSIHVKLNTHRYFSDLNLSGADVSIRLGNGDWKGVVSERLMNDELLLAASPKVIKNGNIHISTLGEYVCLRNSERDYVRTWNQNVSAEHRIFPKSSTIWFNDSATLLEALDSGCGFAVTRRSLVHSDLKNGNLVQLTGKTVDDSLAYYAVFDDEGKDSPAITCFVAWLKSLFSEHEQVRCEPDA